MIIYLLDGLGVMEALLKRFSITETILLCLGFFIICYIFIFAILKFINSLFKDAEKTKKSK